MSILALPLTRLGDSPRYTASDFRKLVLPWFTYPSWPPQFTDPTQLLFRGLSAVRWGVRSIVSTSTSGSIITVTVSPHSGIVAPFRSTSETYSYFLDETLTLTTDVGNDTNYRLVVEISDPSLGYGESPGAEIKIVEEDQASTINGMTLATFNSIACTEVFPWVLPDGRLVFRDMDNMQQYQTFQYVTLVRMTAARCLSTPYTTGVHFTDFIWDGENWRYASPTRLATGLSISTDSATSFTIDGASDFIYTGIAFYEDESSPTSAHLTRLSALTHPSWSNARWCMPYPGHQEFLAFWTTRSGDTFTVEPDLSGLFTPDMVKRENYPLYLTTFFGLVPLTIVDTDWSIPI